MKKVATSILTAGMLVAGILTVSVITSSEAVALEDETSTGTDAFEWCPMNPGGIATSPLGIHVGDAPRPDAPVDREARMAAREARMAERAEHQVYIEGLLSDGVITAEELAELPVDIPLLAEGTPFTDALADGQITQAEWDEFHESRVAEREARMAEREARMAERGAGRGQARGLLSG